MDYTKAIEVSGGGLDFSGSGRVGESGQVKAELTCVECERRSWIIPRHWV